MSVLAQRHAASHLSGPRRLDPSTDLTDVASLIGKRLLTSWIERGSKSCGSSGRSVAWDLFCGCSSKSALGSTT